jgi:hypothetical protein
MNKTVLLISCGALAQELVQIVRLNEWRHVKIQCLPPELHNQPDKLPSAVRAQLEKNNGLFEHIFVAYGDCGTGGKLDAVLQEFGVERLPGVHCYEFFTGSATFRRIAEAEAGSYYLTDFLARHFERIVIQGLGLDKRPELKDLYFGNYRRLVFLSQTDNSQLLARAKAHAAYLGLQFEHHYTGLNRVADQLQEQFVRWQD